MLVASFDGLDQFVERCSQLQLVPVELGHFHRKLGRAARGFTALLQVFRARVARLRRARECAHSRLAPSSFGALSPLAHGPAHGQDGRAQQYKNYDDASDPTDDAYQAAPPPLSA